MDIFKVDFTEVPEGGLMQFLSNLYKTKPKNDFHLEVDTKDVKGNIFVVENAFFSMLILDGHLKSDVKVNLYSVPEFEISCHLFNHEIQYINMDGENISFKTPNGFLMKKNKETKVFIEEKKGLHIQKVNFFFNKNQIELDLYEPFKNLENYFVYAGDSLLHQWKSSIFNHTEVVDEVKKNWLGAKVNELYFLLRNIIIKNSNEEKRELYTDYEIESAHHIQREVTNNLGNKPNVATLEKKYGLNGPKLSKIFRDLFGQTVYQYYKDARLFAAHQDVVNTNKSFTEIAYEYGYTDIHHFSKDLKKTYNTTPSELRKRSQDNDSKE